MGNDLFPVSSTNVPSGPFDLAQVAIFFLSPVVWAPMAAIFSYIFSQTRGTQTNKVGRAICKNLTKFP